MIGIFKYQVPNPTTQTTNNQTTRPNHNNHTSNSGVGSFNWGHLSSNFYNFL